MPDLKPNKLFKVASEFNVTTKSIVDALAGEGFDLANKPNSKVTPEMYRALEEIYGADKARSAEHDKVREEYESRRNELQSQRSESVSIDNFLEPLDDLEPLDEIEPEEPEDVEEPSVEPEDAPEPEPEVDIEPEEEPEVEESGDESVASGKDSEDTEEIDVKDDKVAAETEDEVVPEETTAEVEPDSPEPPTDEEIENPDVNSERTPDEEEAASIIRGRAGRLKGTKVVGKVAVSEEFTEKKVKKRKRKKDRKTDDKPASDSKDTKKKKSGKESTKSASKTKKGRRTRVEEEDVEKKMKETMQQMKSSETVGSRRAKRRRQRKEEREEEQSLLDGMEGEEEVLEVTEFVTVSDLADLLDVSANDVITTCMSLGLMVSINQRLDAATIELVAEEYGREVDFVDAEEMIEEIEEEEDAPEDLLPRAPVITVMGHVDHGKTSLLDYIRETKVAAGEAGGITQHIGAYAVETTGGKKITFLDTPGHEAFTAMRSRGAQITDIVILVVAADDAVMPQTIEAINHAKAAGVSIVIAINKIDKDGANPDKIKKQLSEHGVVVEEWGGENQCAEVSAQTGAGIEELLEKVLIEAELMELKANPNRRATGVVLESRIDKGKGVIANVLVHNGTLQIGDPFVAGPCFGRVRAMENEHGTRINKAGPSIPIQLMGFDSAPQSGDRLVVPKDEKTAKDIANQRQQLKREQNLRKTKHLTLDDLSRRMALGEVSELNIIIKADVDGSIEALSGALQKLSTDEVAVNIIHTGSGAITESDVLLASASEGIIIGFQVRPTTPARKLAETESIDVRLFSVIYDAVDEVRDALEGLLRPAIKEQILGLAEIRDTFKVSKVGTIAGCIVSSGKISRNQPVRIIRDGVVIYEGKIASLKRFKEDVKEVQNGYECGISIEGYNDIKVGDEIECFEVVEEKRKLEDSPR